MSKKYTSRIEAAASPALRSRLEAEARRRHCNLSKTVRMLLAEALTFSESTLPALAEPEEYEIRLTDVEVARLQKLGYNIALPES